MNVGFVTTICIALCIFLSSVISAHEQSVIVVGTLDGTVYGIDSDTGDKIWSATTGGPLFSSSHAHGPDGQVTLIIPGLDGSIYVRVEGNDLKKLPVTAKDLVAASPYVSDDGTYYLGSKTTSLYSINPSTGELYVVYAAVGGLSNILDGSCPANIPVGTLLLGRTDYGVHAMNSATGSERWNFTISEFTASYTGTAQQGNVVASTPTVVYKLDGGISLLETDGRVRWSVQLHSPAVSVYSVGENGRIQELGLAGGSRLYCSGRRCYGASERPQGFQAAMVPAVYIHQLDGHLYALSNLQIEVPHEKTEISSREHKYWPAAIIDDDDHLTETSMDEICEPDGTRYPNCLLGAHVAVGSDPVSFSPLTADSVTALTTQSTSDFVTWQQSQQQPAQLALTGTVLPASAWVAYFIAIAAVILASIALAIACNAERQLRAIREMKRLRTNPLEALKDLDNQNVAKKAVSALYKNTRLQCMECGLRCLSDEMSASHLEQHFLFNQWLKAARRNGRGWYGNGNDSGAIQFMPHLNVIPSGTEYTRVGKIFVSNIILGYGSHGTMVYAGMLEGRSVAVKRMLVHFFEIAHSEISLLMQSDEHSHVIRYFAKEQDDQFIYLALELCTASLSDAIAFQERTYTSSDSSAGPAPPSPHKLPPDVAVPVLTQSVAPIRRSVPVPLPLIDSYGTPTPITIRLLKELLLGIVHLHNINIVHRDLKPQNILLTNNGSVKISDMGLARKLDNDRSSFSTLHAGTTGWIPAECLRQVDRLTKAVDIFAAGCVLFYTLTNGKHPFGDKYDRESNIMKNVYDLSPIAHLPEAHDLIASMIHPEPEMRINAVAAVNHPCFWDAATKLNFLQEVSDRLESEAADSELVVDIETRASTIFGGRDWLATLDDVFRENLTKYRKYKNTVRDLLRVIRNKKHHYRDMPLNLQQLLGPLPDGFLSYFTTRFPLLLLQSFYFVKTHLSHEYDFKPFLYGASK